MTARDLEVRPYQRGDEEEILRLFNLVFSEGDARFEPRTLESWRWEYLDNPAGRQIVLGLRDGQVIAHYACLPVVVQVDGEIGLAGQGVDSMVHPDHRRGLKREGPFLSVARAYFERWGNARVCKFGYGFPNRKALRVGVKILRYEPAIQPLRTLFVNFFEGVADDAIGRPHAEAAEVREVARFSGDLDELWERHRRHYPMAIVRDTRYVNWRYAACPHIPYRCFEVRDRGDLIAWFVTRAAWQNQPIQALVDFFAGPGEERALGLALRHAVRLGREAGMARVETWLPESYPWFEAARRLGFGTEPCPNVLCIMRYPGRPSLEWVQRHWYFTIGDSDAF